MLRGGTHWSARAAARVNVLHRVLVLVASRERRTESAPSVTYTYSTYSEHGGEHSTRSK
jgi:hypothetical protein